MVATHSRGERRLWTMRVRYGRRLGTTVSLESLWGEPWQEGFKHLVWGLSPHMVWGLSPTKGSQQRSVKNWQRGLLTSTSHGNGKEYFCKPSPSPSRAVRGYTELGQQHQTNAWHVTRLAGLHQGYDEGTVNRGTYGHIQSAACLATKKSVTAAHNKCLNELINVIIKHKKKKGKIVFYKRGYWCVFQNCLANICVTTSMRSRFLQQANGASSDACFF